MRGGLQKRFRFRERMEEAHQVRFGKQCRLAFQFRRIADGRLQQLLAARNFRHQQIAKVGQQIAAEVSQVVTAHHHIVNYRERFSGLVLGNAFDYADQNVGAGHAQGQLDVVFRDLRAGITDYLIEGRLRVAH